MILFDSWEKFPIGLIITLVIFIMHRENISRLIKGTELKVGNNV